MEPKSGKVKRVNPRWTHDREVAKNYVGIVGVDEAGRGCLAGPVVAGCVILSAGFFSNGKNRKLTCRINDSKQFNESTREELYQVIQYLIDEKKVFGATGLASVDEIEEYNIVGATCLAMRRAMESASLMSNSTWVPCPHDDQDLFGKATGSVEKWKVLVDGRRMKGLNFRHEGLIKGDSISLAVAMASLLAKVTRDCMMKRLCKEFPGYDFSSNKGYGSPFHIKALQEYGPTNHHRPKFLRNLINQAGQAKGNNLEQTRLSLV